MCSISLPKDRAHDASTVKHRHHFKDVKIKIAGFGGQGVLLLGQLLIEMGMREALEVSWLPSYGPEMRSGSAHCHVCLSKERIGSPLVSQPDVLVAMNEFSLRKFAHEVPSGGLILYNGASLPADFAAPGVQLVAIPAAEIADKLGSTKVANIVMMGALLEETECLAPGTALSVLEDKVKKLDLLELTARRSPPAGCSSTTRRTRARSVNPTASPRTTKGRKTDFMEAQCPLRGPHDTHGAPKASPVRKSASC
jgi:Pyruvate/2-oxoacid:ferredoxin oxidoreductase gamma subunit